MRHQDRDNVAKRLPTHLTATGDLLRDTHRVYTSAPVSLANNPDPESEIMRATHIRVTDTR